MTSFQEIPCIGQIGSAQATVLSAVVVLTTMRVPSYYDSAFLAALSVLVLLVWLFEALQTRFAPHEGTSCIIVQRSTTSTIDNTSATSTTEKTSTSTTDMRSTTDQSKLPFPSAPLEPIAFPRSPAFAPSQQSLPSPPLLSLSSETHRPAAAVEAIAPQKERSATSRRRLDSTSDTATSLLGGWSPAQYLARFGRLQITEPSGRILAPNTRDRIKFENDYFVGEMLLLVKTEPEDEVNISFSHF